MRFQSILAVGIILFAQSSLRAEELVENPEFASWSKFKKGTSVTMRSLKIAKGKTSEVTVTTTLLELGADSLTLEISSVVKEKDFKPEPERRVVRRLIALPKGLTKEEFALGKPPGTVEEGTETVQCGGLELPSKWYRYKAEVAGIKIEGKRWVSNNVPGNIVKNEMTTSGDLNETNKLELTQLKKPE